jgi:phage gp46-like protein
MRQQAEGALQALVDQLMAQQSIQVRTVTVADGTLVATGSAA